MHNNLVFMHLFFIFLSYKQIYSLLGLKFSWWGGWWCSSGYWHHVDSSVDGTVSEKHTVSIFRAEVAMLGSGEIYILLKGRLREWTNQGWGMRGKVQANRESPSRSHRGRELVESPDTCLKTPYRPRTYPPTPFLIPDWPTPSAFPSTNPI
jgi:hypothetical protein